MRKCFVKQDYDQWIPDQGPPGKFFVPVSTRIFQAPVGHLVIGAQEAMSENIPYV